MSSMGTWVGNIAGRRSPISGHRQGSIPDYCRKSLTACGLRPTSAAMIATYAAPAREGARCDLISIGGPRDRSVMREDRNLFFGEICFDLLQSGAVLGQGIPVSAG